MPDKQKTMSDIRAEMHKSKKKDGNPIGSVHLDKAASITDRLAEAYALDRATVDAFVDSPLYAELVQVITELEYYDTQEVCALTGRPEVTDRLRGQIAAYRRVLTLLTVIQSKFHKKAVK